MTNAVSVALIFGAAVLLVAFCDVCKVRIFGVGVFLR